MIFFLRGDVSRPFFCAIVIHVMLFDDIKKWCPLGTIFSICQQVALSHYTDLTHFASVLGLNAEQIKT